MNPQGHDLLLVKFLMVGDSGVGKTSVLRRYCDDEFSTKFMTTIGVDYKDRDAVIDNQFMRLQIWDTAGQERFRNLTASFYRRTQGIFLVYDTTNPSSFTSITSWLKEIEDHAGPQVCKVLFGNKCDDMSLDKVSPEEAEALGNEYGMPAFEGSAKASVNVEEAFASLAKMVKERWEEETGDSLEVQDKIIDIGIPKKKRSKGCC